MTVRTIPVPARWAMLDASTNTGTTDGRTARVEITPYIASNGDAAVLIETLTPGGYTTVAVPLAAARIIARAIANAADEARDDLPAELAEYLIRFGL